LSFRFIPKQTKTQGKIRGLAEQPTGLLWHKTCIQVTEQLLAIIQPGEFDGKDRRRRHEDGEGK
jgi:hypothetical protein